MGGTSRKEKRERRLDKKTKKKEGEKKMLN